MHRSSTASMPFRLPAAALLALPAVLLAAGLQAQAVRVTVTEESGGAPVAGALVRVENEAGELVRAGFSDARGTVRLDVDGAGDYVLSAERAGYGRAREAVQVGARGETAAALRMPDRPLGLDTLRVVALSSAREVGRQTFERRRLTGSGVYLDSAYIAQVRARWPGELLGSVPGIEVRTVHGRTGWRIPTTRRGGRCLNALVNGLPYYGGWPRWVQLEETLRTTNVVAVEVYREYEEVPTELQRFARTPRPCGLIVYWTQDGWSSRSRGSDAPR